MYACLQKEVTTLFNATIYFDANTSAKKVLIQVYSKQLIVKDTTFLPLNLRTIGVDDGSRPPSNMAA